MKKESFLARLEDIRLRAEAADGDEREILKLEVISLLVEYNGDPVIRQKVEELPL